MKEVIVIIDPKGGAKIEINGACGPTCQDVTHAVASAIGQVTSETIKPEFHQRVEEAAIEMGIPAG